MAAPQPPGSNQSRTVPASNPLGRALMWPFVAVGLGVILIYSSFDTSAQGTPRSPQIRPAAAAPAPTKAADASAPELVLPRSAPKRLSILEIAVDAPFTELSVGASGQLDAPPPDNNNLVGWFRGGATPGERGTSIVAGHVDTKTGPAVFLLLGALKPGSRVDITREDGTVAIFTVDSVETFSKARFPNERVYADTPSPQLRLITCGGDYDRKAKDYEDNVVVFAHLDSVK
ncbi:class F sortase [Streptomyces lunaelactis]|uniref:Class F sortase n=1 Tax=Streptomyces lunaelactis TaxID=1535768 RepID=A0A2R4TCL8_9ACTN|nr:class F sortase [Streptomyces lunaelactis]AVZ76869.1 class F sortase [Streptomyces lunaelactis]NUK83935.1 class F sortase [Streptomyces lunaelactis]